MVYAIVAALMIILDQGVKYWVAGNIEYASGIKVLIPNVLSMINIHNSGCAFSFLSEGGARIGFILIAGVFTVIVIIALATNIITGKVGRWSAIAVVAGGLGNCIDRIIYGYVQDMFKTEFMNFAIFNVADIFITVGCIVFILYVLLGKDPIKETDEDELVDEEPVKLSRKEKRAAKKATKRQLDDEDERDGAPVSAPVSAPVEAKAPVKKDEPVLVDDEEDLRAAPRAEKKTTRKDRRAKYDSDFEQYKAAKAESAKVAEEEAAPAAEDNPFSEWDSANRKAESDVRIAMPRKKAAESDKAFEAWDSASSAPRQPAAVSAAPAEDAVKIYSKPASQPATPISDDFSLDDILAEFK